MNDESGHTVDGREAERALIDAKFARDRDALVALATDASKPDLVRVSALQSLRRHPDVDLLPSLVRLLDDRGEGVALTAIGAIARIDGPEATRVLQDALFRYDGVTTAWVIKFLADRRALSQGAAVELLSSSERTVRHGAVMALARTGNSESAPALLAAARREKGRLRRAAMRAYVRVVLRGRRTTAKC